MNGLADPAVAPSTFAALQFGDVAADSYEENIAPSQRLHPIGQKAVVDQHFVDNEPKARVDAGADHAMPAAGDAQAAVADAHRNRAVGEGDKLKALGRLPPVRRKPREDLVDAEKQIRLG